MELCLNKYWDVVSDVIIHARKLFLQIETNKNTLCDINVIFGFDSCIVSFT